MAWTAVMSERELKRVAVVAQVEDGSLTARRAAGVLGLSVRQVQRLKKRMAEEGPSGLAHKLRSRPSNRKIAPRVQEWALGVIREKYADYRPTLAAESLEEVHCFKVGP